MDISSVFKTEVFRPVVITLVPGVAAIAPYFFLLDHYFPGAASVVAEHETTAVILVVLAAIGVGYILEDLGSRIESLIWGRLKDAAGQDDAEWFSYLRTSFKSEPIGQKYIGDLVLRMKFENSSCPALLLLACGIIWLRCVGYIQATLPVVAVVLAIIVLAAYLLYESIESTRLLRTVRKHLLLGVNVVQ
jgi:hypothetical protein